MRPIGTISMPSGRRISPRSIMVSTSTEWRSISAAASRLSRASPRSRNHRRPRLAIVRRLARCRQVVQGHRHAAAIKSPPKQIDGKIASMALRTRRRDDRVPRRATARHACSGRLTRATVRSRAAGPCRSPIQFAIGLQTVLKPTVSGTFYLRVNDSAARLDDNAARSRLRH